MKNSKILVLVLFIVIAGGIYIFYSINNKETSLSNTYESTEQKSEENITPTNAPTLRLITKNEYLNYKNKVTIPKEVRQEESYYLNTYPKVVRLNERCLEINLLNGEKKSLCNDEIRDQWPSTTYIFSGYIPNFGYWFYVGLWEGTSGLLIDEKTGEEIKMFEGKPIVSPNGKQLLSTSVDLYAGYNPSGFQVWEKNGDSYILKSRYIVELSQPGGIFWGVSEPVWVTNDSFYFIKPSLSYSSSKAEFYDEYAEFSF